VGLWQSQRQWTIEEIPEVLIGDEEGAPAYQLFRGRDAARLSDGRIVVANAGTSELRYYDARGRHERTVGQKGRGPGEFENLTRIARLPGDTVVAFDYSRSSRAYFAPDGGYVRTVVTDRTLLPRGPESPPPSLEMLPDGGLLVHDQEPTRLTPGAERPRLRIGVLSGNGRSVDSLGTFPGVENYRPPTDPRNSVLRPFGRITYVAAAGSRVYVGDNDRARVMVYSRRGTLERVIALPGTARAVTAADREAALGRMLEQLRERNALTPERERMIRSLELPATMPWFTGLAADRAGNVWVRAPVSGAEPVRWTVYGPTGERLAVATTPPRLRVLEIGDGYVLGVATDDDGVERVQQHRLHRR